MSELPASIDGLDLNTATAAGAYVALALLNGDIARFEHRGEGLVLLMKDRADGDEFSVVLKVSPKGQPPAGIDDETIHVAILSIVVIVYGLCRDGSVFDDPSNSTDSIVRFLRAVIGDNPQLCFAAMSQISAFSETNPALCGAIAKQWRKQYDLLTAKAEAL